MPTSSDTERRLEALENLLLFGGGVAAGTASGRQLAAAAARGTARGGLRGLGTAARLGVTVAQRHPVGTAATLAYLGYIHRDDIRDVAATLGEGLEEVAQLIPGGPTTAFKKRTISKANRAVKYGMSVLKAGSKATTGADKGKLAKGSFKRATVAAGLANPNTPSRIKKGKSKLMSLARKIRAWWK